MYRRGWSIQVNPTNHETQQSPQATGAQRVSWRKIIILGYFLDFVMPAKTGLPRLDPANLNWSLTKATERLLHILHLRFWNFCFPLLYFQVYTEGENTRKKLELNIWGVNYLGQDFVQPFLSRIWVVFVWSALRWPSSLETPLILDLSKFKLTLLASCILDTWTQTARLRKLCV